MEYFSQEAIDRVNQECYNHCADTWDRFPFPQALPNLIQKNYQPLLGKNVLDVGSGTGVLAKWLADQGFEVLCIEPSTEMTRRCREKGLQTQTCSIQTFKSENQFGMIFAILSLIHIPKKDFPAQLKKLAEALPQGGLLFLGMLEGKGEGFSEATGGYPRFFAYYSMQEIENQTNELFVTLDRYQIVSNGIGYFLLVFKKK